MSDQNSHLIYKIAERTAWDDALASGKYLGSADDNRDGFIHFSTAEQLAGTARKHFAGQLDLLLIAVDPAALGEALKWEASRGGALFPHLYAALPASAALWVRDLPLATDGIPQVTTVLSNAGT